MAKKKKKSLAGLLDQVAVALQKVVRLEGANSQGMCRCVTCNKFEHWKEINGGHFIPRVKTATKITRENIHPQCVSCNQYRAEEAKIYYYKFMVNKYGQSFVDELVQKSKEVVKYDRVDLELKLKEYRQIAVVLEEAL